MAECGPIQPSVSLDTCADEPIHIPGHIQPHGALLAFDLAGHLVAWSANAPELVGCDLAVGLPLAPLCQRLDPALAAAADALIAEAVHGTVYPSSVEVRLPAGVFDGVLHAHLNRLVLEFESRSTGTEELATFVLKAHRAVDRLKGQRTTAALLNAAVTEVRALTGFDRVMAYRFRHDESGEVVAEARGEDLVPYLGQRYPASDIPTQARRLYLLNTLRMIADVHYVPVPVLSPGGAEPLDMSHAVLRSVSPIHLEYLQNMGVGASMSVSIVVNGRLWGLLACHHLAARQVPYSIRMACDVMAQVISLAIQSLESQRDARAAAEAAAVRTRLMREVLEAEDLLGALSLHAVEVAASLEADALVLAQEGKITVHGDLPREVAIAIVQSLPDPFQVELFTYGQRSDWPPALLPLQGKWVGLLAFCFDPINGGWLLALRIEQVETVRWGGRPEKHLQTGPLGPRLTPRGSFEEWCETVRDQAVPWSPGTVAHANALLQELRRTVNSRYAEVDRARTQLLAMLGHDLRDPLNSISLAAEVLRRGGQEARMGQRIQSATGRMQRLVAQVMDFSRIRTGLGLEIRPVPVDLAVLVREMVEESGAARPGSTYLLDLPETVPTQVDEDRMAQVISNLLSNARHHGQAGEPIGVQLAAIGDRVRLSIRNRGAPIEPELIASLFDPFKRQSLGNPRNRTGLGLGLYIAREIVAGHHGAIWYEHSGGEVVFHVELPRVPAAATVEQSAGR